MNKKIILKEIKNKIDQLAENQLAESRTVFLFGVNPYTEYIYNYLYEHKISLYAVLDNASELQGKQIGDIEIISPEKVVDFHYKEVLILIASQHIDAMKEQLKTIFGGKMPMIYSLFDFVRYNKQLENRKMYWLEENYQQELQILMQGKRVYERLMDNHVKLVISPTVSIGDNFLWTLTFDAYKQRTSMNTYRIVVCSQGAYHAVALSEKEDRIVLIEFSDMDALVKYVTLMGEERLDCLILYPRLSIIRCLDIMASWKKMSWEEIYPRYLFQLEKDYPIHFPCIRAGDDMEIRLKAYGIVKGKTVILSPYTNTVGEIPLVFWEILTKRLHQKKYSVITNIAGNQKPICGTEGLSIPLKVCASFLEYAGYFIALRNGLCDIAGQADCKQIIIFRDREQLHYTEMGFNDLHVDNISPKAEYVLYDAENYQLTIDRILNKLDISMCEETLKGGRYESADRHRLSDRIL